MGAGGVGTLKVVTGWLNAAGYVRLICHTLVEDGRKLCGTDFVFQQDGAPCHTAKSTMSWFERKGITVSPWPSQSPDLNPIEHLWEIMKKRLEKRPCKNMDELKEAIFETWESITSNTTGSLVLSLPMVGVPSIRPSNRN